MSVTLSRRGAHSQKRVPWEREQCVAARDRATYTCTAAHTAARVGSWVVSGPSSNKEYGSWGWGVERHPALFEGLSCLRLCSWLHSEEVLVQVVLCYQHSA